MLRVAIASGKGGTGKTTLATNLALLLAERGLVHLLDCDVEAPNAALFLKPVIELSEEVTRAVPFIDEAVCTRCGKCSEFCRFHALAVTPRKALVFPELCHGCGGCAWICPKSAISEIPRPIGRVAEGFAESIRFTEGSLKTGETATVHLIHSLRRRESAADFVLLDSPPGTSCPVVAAISGAHLVILVAEPTPFGLNDLRLAAELTRTLGVNTNVVINRHGIGDDCVERFCASAGIPILGRIADDRRIAELYSRGEPPLHVLPSFRAEMEAMAGRLAEAGVTA